ncbi:MAG: hypothetical protein ACRER2_09920, partial [Methylococcales bacterium]
MAVTNVVDPNAQDTGISNHSQVQKNVQKRPARCRSTLCEINNNASLSESSKGSATVFQVKLFLAVADHDCRTTDMRAFKQKWFFGYTLQVQVTNPHTDRFARAWSNVQGA